MIYAGSSWGNELSRAPTLPSFFVLELLGEQLLAERIADHRRNPKLIDGLYDAAASRDDRASAINFEESRRACGSHRGGTTLKRDAEASEGGFHVGREQSGRRRPYSARECLETS